jgi:hypothetical protein
MEQKVDVEKASKQNFTPISLAESLNFLYLVPILIIEGMNGNQTMKKKNKINKTTQKRKQKTK